MSRGSTLKRTVRRNQGVPVSKKEKLRIATFGLLKISLGAVNPQQEAIRTLSIIGINPKKQEKISEPESTKTE